MTGLLEALDKLFREQAIKITEQATVIEAQRRKPYDSGPVSLTVYAMMASDCKHLRREVRLDDVGRVTQSVCLDCLMPCPCDVHRAVRS